mmetsp:Transcript_30826/g.51227  ORF Transcript_30826/g.51227 Transcript_30826/m.51227 type:complete len:232 (+) Transcript_30826:441-1136(+)
MFKVYRMLVGFCLLASCQVGNVQGWVVCRQQHCLLSSCTGVSSRGQDHPRRTSVTNVVREDLGEEGTTGDDCNNRRQVIANSIKSILSLPLLSPLFVSTVASAEKPSEFVNIGTQAPPPADGTAPFITLRNGVKIKEIRLGTGDAVVTPNSRVDIQCSGRLLNLNGVSFYNTKNNNPDGFGAIPLSLDLGKGMAVPGHTPFQSHKSWHTMGSQAWSHNRLRQRNNELSTPW